MVRPTPHLNPYLIIQCESLTQKALQHLTIMTATPQTVPSPHMHVLIAVTKPYYSTPPSNRPTRPFSARLNPIFPPTFLSLSLSLYSFSNSRISLSLSLQKSISFCSILVQCSSTIAPQPCLQESFLFS